MLRLLNIVALTVYKPAWQQAIFGLGGHAFTQLTPVRHRFSALLIAFAGLHLALCRQHSRSQGLRRP